MKAVIYVCYKISIFSMIKS